MHLNKISWLFISALLLQGCSAPKEITPAFTADPAAFEYGVSEAMEMQIYISECGKLGGDTRTQADAAAKSWYERNWPQTQAADIGYSQKLAEHTIVYNEEKIALPALKKYATLEKSVQLRLDQTRHSRSSVVDICTRKINSYKDGSMDLSRNQNADLYLKSLATSPAIAPYKVPSLTGNLVTNNDPGRSQYNLEKTMSASGCVSSEILTLRNDWPYEVYGAFCADGKTIFVRCEWGECQLQR